MLAAVLLTAATAACAPAPAPAPAPAAPPESVTLVATGDVLLHQGASLVAGAARGEGYDFGPVFAPVAPVLRAADLAVCHLETPVAPDGGPFRGYPSFAVQPQIADALAGAGYDLCSTASNHSLDDGFDGLVRTLDTLAAAGLATSGTFRTEAEARTPRIVDAGGVRVGHVAWTFGLNGVSLPAGREWAVNVFDAPAVHLGNRRSAEPAGWVGRVLADARRTRAAGAEIVVASVHCCAEYDHEPEPTQDAIARALLASPDVDLVLGHHAHVVQPFERIGDEWVAHGLGNHVAQHRTRGYPTEDSVIARFTFTRGTDGRFTATRAEAVPTRIDLGADAVRVLPTGGSADPVDLAAHARVADVLGRRGAVSDGLAIVPR